MIEGESLLNDGVAILLFEIFKDILEEEEALSIGRLILKIFLQFLQIAVGGPVFGWIMARVTIFMLSFVFNDPPVEISATIVAAYLTYWLSEDVLSEFLKNSSEVCVVIAISKLIQPNQRCLVSWLWSCWG